MRAATIFANMIAPTKRSLLVGLFLILSAAAAVGEADGEALGLAEGARLGANVGSTASVGAFVAPVGEKDGDRMRAHHEDGERAPPHLSPRFFG